MRFERVVFLDALSGSSAFSKALDKRFAPFFLLFVAFARFRWPPRLDFADIQNNRRETRKK